MRIVILAVALLSIICFATSARAQVLPPDPIGGCVLSPSPSAGAPSAQLPMPEKRSFPSLAEWTRLWVATRLASLANPPVRNGAFVLRRPVSTRSRIRVRR